MFINETPGSRLQARTIPYCNEYTIYTLILTLESKADEYKETKQCKLMDNCEAKPKAAQRRLLSSWLCKLACRPVGQQ